MEFSSFWCLCAGLFVLMQVNGNGKLVVLRLCE
jgi:hypothetical protein